MSLQKQVDDLQREFKDHKHTGLDSPLLATKLPNKGSLTDVDDTAIDATTYSSVEKAVIDNNRTRIEEIEAALKAVGLLT